MKKKDSDISLIEKVDYVFAIPDKTIFSLLNEIFSDYNNIYFPEIGKFVFYSSDFETEILSIIQRHPMRQEQIMETFFSKDLNKNNILSRLEKLEL